MHEDTVVALTVVTFAWGVLSRWLGERFITGPLVLTVAGLLLANPSWGVVSVDIDHTTVHHLAEVTLALLLFSDASAVPFGRRPSGSSADGPAARNRTPAVDHRRYRRSAVLLFPKMPWRWPAWSGPALLRRTLR